MSTRQSYGPIEGHWMCTLQLVESEQDGNSFRCLKCVRDAGSSSKRCIYRSSNGAAMSFGLTWT